MHFRTSTLSLALFTLLTSTVHAQQPDPEAYNPKAFGRPEGVDIGNNFMDGNARMMKYLEDKAISHVNAVNSANANRNYNQA